MLATLVVVWPFWLIFYIESANGDSLLQATKMLLHHDIKYRQQIGLMSEKQACTILLVDALPKESQYMKTNNENGPELAFVETWHPRIVERIGFNCFYIISKSQNKKWENFAGSEVRLIYLNSSDFNSIQSSGVKSVNIIPHYQDRPSYLFHDANQFEKKLVTIQSNCNALLKLRLSETIIDDTTDIFGNCISPKRVIRGKTLVAAGFGVPPYIYISPKGQIVGGIDMEILKMLAEKLEFSLIPKYAPEWGDVQPNGSWSGIIGLLQSKKMDIGFGNLAITSDRAQVVDFSFFTYISKFQLMTRKPQPLDSFTKPFDPLDPLAWISFFIGALIVGFACKLMLDLKNPNKKQNRVLLDVFMMLFQTSSDSDLKWLKTLRTSLSGSIVLITWFIGIAFFVMFYNSTLRSSLMAVKYEKPKDYVQNFLDDNLPVYIISGSSFALSMKYSQYASYRTAVKLAEENNYFFEFTPKAVDRVVQSVIDTGSAVTVLDVFTFTFINDFLKKHGYQPFHITKEVLLALLSGFAVNKDEHFIKEALDPLIMKLQEGGIIQKMMEPPPKIDAKLNDSQKIDLFHSMSIFLLYGIFNFIAIVVFLLEQQFSRKK